MADLISPERAANMSAQELYTEGNKLAAELNVVNHYPKPPQSDQSSDRSYVEKHQGGPPSDREVDNTIKYYERTFGRDSPQFRELVATLGNMGTPPALVDLKERKAFEAADLPIAPKSYEYTPDLSSLARHGLDADRIANVFSVSSNFAAEAGFSRIDGTALIEAMAATGDVLRSHKSDDERAKWLDGQEALLVKVAGGQKQAEEWAKAASEVLDQARTEKSREFARTIAEGPGAHSVAIISLLRLQREKQRELARQRTLK